MTHTAPTHRPSRLRLYAFVALGCAALAYPIIEAVVAAGWSEPAYSYSHNYVSDLGVPICVQSPRAVCSPRHSLMNGMFYALGTATVVGMLALASTLRGVRRWVVGILGVIVGIGVGLVGVEPGSFAEDLMNDPVQMMLHALGAALAILGTALLALTYGAFAWRSRRALALNSLILGAVTPLMLGAQLVAAEPNLGLGIGGFQRAGVYAAIGWLGVIAVSGIYREVRARRAAVAGPARS